METAAIAGSLDSFIRLGVAHWPGAHHFVLLEIDIHRESSTGEGWVVCGSCVREAALVARERLAGGSRLVLDLVGETEATDEPCHLCGAEP